MRNQERLFLAHISIAFLMTLSSGISKTSRPFSSFTSRVESRLKEVELAVINTMVERFTFVFLMSRFGPSSEGGLLQVNNFPLPIRLLKFCRFQGQNRKMTD